MQGKIDWSFIQQIKATSQEVAAFVIAELYWLSGLTALTSAPDRPEKEEMGWALSCIQLREDIVEFIENSSDFDCQRAYWERVSLWGIQQEDTEIVDNYVKIFLKFQRPFSLIDSLAYSDWNSAELVIQILEAALKLYPDAESNGLTLPRVGSSDIEKMFQKLYSHEGMPEFEIAKLELAFIRTFDFDFEPKYLVDQVLQHPLCINSK